jgi:hypothetical protein
VLKSLDKYSQKVMLALTTENIEKGVSKYLLTFDLENWKILTDNYDKLTPFEADNIFSVIKRKIDFHMVIDIASLAHIIGQSVSFSTDLLRLFKNVNIAPVEQEIISIIDNYLKSPIAEERRIGLLIAGYLNREEFFDTIEKMSNYDVLFEDAYFALGQMRSKKINKKLLSKFILLGKNVTQKEVIAKILAKKGNPLATLWLLQRKGLTLETPQSKLPGLTRQLIWSGIRPSKFIYSSDDFLQAIILRIISSLRLVLLFDIDILAEINLEKVISERNKLYHEFPTLQILKLFYQL